MTHSQRSDRADRPDPPNRFRAALTDRTGLPMVIAHRGDSSRAPENTLEAAELGHASGADAWEFDVQLTRDGVPVVVHDESLIRTTDVALRFAGDPRERRGFLVSDFDLDEIRSLDAGSWFLDAARGPRTAYGFGTETTLGAVQRNRFTSGAVRVPTLAEALELTIRLDWLANVEVKSFPNSDPDLLDAVLSAIDQAGAVGRVLISSFDLADVARSAQLRPEIPTGALTSTPLHRPVDYLRSLVGAEVYHPSHHVLGAGADRYLRRPGPASLRSADIDALNEARIPILVYTVNDDRPDGLAAHLAAAGVRGIFTDTPGPMLRLLRGGTG